MNSALRSICFAAMAMLVLMWTTDSPVKSEHACCLPWLCAGEGEPYQLPEHMRDAVEAQYRRDVARVHGEDAAKYDDEYKSFMQVRLQCLGSGLCENLNPTLLIFSRSALVSL